MCEVETEKRGENINTMAYMNAGWVAKKAVGLKLFCCSDVFVVSRLYFVA